MENTVTGRIAAEPPALIFEVERSFYRPSRRSALDREDKKRKHRLQNSEVASSISQPDSPNFIVERQQPFSTGSPNFNRSLLKISENSAFSPVHLHTTTTATTTGSLNDCRRVTTTESSSKSSSGSIKDFCKRLLNVSFQNAGSSNNNSSCLRKPPKEKSGLRRSCDLLLKTTAGKSDRETYSHYAGQNPLLTERDFRVNNGTTDELDSKLSNRQQHVVWNIAKKTFEPPVWPKIDEAKAKTLKPLLYGHQKNMNKVYILNKAESYHKPLSVKSDEQKIDQEWLTMSKSSASAPTVPEDKWPRSLHVSYCNIDASSQSSAHRPNSGVKSPYEMKLEANRALQNAAKDHVVNAVRSPETVDTVKTFVNYFTNAKMTANDEPKPATPTDSAIGSSWREIHTDNFSLANYGATKRLSSLFDKSSRRRQTVNCSLNVSEKTQSHDNHDQFSCDGHKKWTSIQQQDSRLVLAPEIDDSLLKNTRQQLRKHKAVCLAGDVVEKVDDDAHRSPERHFKSCAAFVVNKTASVDNNVSCLADKDTHKVEMGPTSHGDVANVLNVEADEEAFKSDENADLAMNQTQLTLKSTDSSVVTQSVAACFHQQTTNQVSSRAKLFEKIANENRKNAEKSSFCLFKKLENYFTKDNDANLVLNKDNIKATCQRSHTAYVKAKPADEQSFIAPSQRIVNFAPQLTTRFFHEQDDHEDEGISLDLIEDVEHEDESSKLDIEAKTKFFEQKSKEKINKTSGAPSIEKSSRRTSKANRRQTQPVTPDELKKARAISFSKSDIAFNYQANRYIQTGLERKSVSKTSLFDGYFPDAAIYRKRDEEMCKKQEQQLKKCKKVSLW